MREIKVKFIVERAEIKYLSQAYSLGPMGFPSYDEVLEFMDGGCTCSLNESNSFCEGDCWEWGDAEVVGQVQFTGLLDKNGVEIYESDCFKDNDGIVAVVMFGEYEHTYHDGMNGWYLRVISNGDIYDLSAFMAGEYEVVGNSHENPELLQ